MVATAYYGSIIDKHGCLKRSWTRIEEDLNPFDGRLLDSISALSHPGSLQVPGNRGRLNTS
jgi:hypothetical protein